MQDFESLIKSRISCRNFSDNELKREEINELVAPVILGHPAQPKSVASNPNPRKDFAIN